MDFAHAIIAATVAKLSAGVSVEPSYFMSFRGDGVRVDTPYHTPAALEAAIAAAHQAGRKSVHDKCVDLWKDEFLAAARVAAINECGKVCNSMDKHQNPYDCADAIRALIGTNLTTGEIK
jgi:hypothetical protein